MNAVCLLCRVPHEEWISFLSTFKDYQVYIVVDDNTADYTAKYAHFSSLHIIQIPNSECSTYGYLNMNFCMRKSITAWEKAMYYFTRKNRSHDRIWFFEDDVFFHAEDTLRSIDRAYEDGDLLSNQYTENLTGDKSVWNWPHVDMRLPPPWHHAMCCAIRVTKRLLDTVLDYAEKHKTLFFLEAMFPTLCKQNSLIYHTPSELNYIDYKINFTETDITTKGLYHPIKEINRHRLIRG